MRVKWSQLVYRSPGSDNEVGLALAYASSQGEVLRFQDGLSDIGLEPVGYLALVPLAVPTEEELDEWVEVEKEIFLEHNPNYWMSPVEKTPVLTSFRTALSFLGSVFSFGAL